MLRGHQHFAAFVARRNHVANVFGRRGERFFADDVLARFEGGDGERRVIGRGRADVDDVDVGIGDQVVGLGIGFGDVVFLGFGFENGRDRIGEGDHFGVFGGVPAGEMCGGDAADANDADFQG